MTVLVLLCTGGRVTGLLSAWGDGWAVVDGVRLEGVQWILRLPQREAVA